MANLASCRTFFPVSRGKWTSGLRKHQRYRHSFGDKRLGRRARRVIAKMVNRRSGKAHHLASSRAQRAGVYRFLSNEKVTLAELIHYVTDLDDPSLGNRKDVLALIDSCSIGLRLQSEKRMEWAHRHGVIGNDKNPGFSVMPSLLLDNQTNDCFGLGDIVLYDRPKSPPDKQQKKRLRRQRLQLTLEHKESSCWLVCARNTAAQLAGCERLTFVMDQGADQLEVLAQIRQQTGRDFIVRSKVDRLVRSLAQNSCDKMSSHLEQAPVVARRAIAVPALDHLSKTAGKRVKRRARQSTLEAKAIRVQLNNSYDHRTKAPLIEEPLSVVEVSEDPSTVPLGEQPIKWRLLTTWPVTTTQQVWAVVDAYRSRWHVEQLFRVLKKGGIDIEKSQLDSPHKIKLLLVMALKASAQAIRLTTLRSGEHFVPLADLFTPEEHKILRKMNGELSGKTEKVTNPHDEESAAWAAWVVARMGGWHGYESQGLAGPVSMDRGLKELGVACRYAKIFGGP